ncbi:serine hydrolase [Arthrobacter sp. MDT3-24]
MYQTHFTSQTRMRLRLWLLVGLATCMAAGIMLAGFIARPATASGDLQSFTEQLDRGQAKWLTGAEVRGASVALVRNGEVVWRNGYGQADAARGLPVTADTVFTYGIDFQSGDCLGRDAARRAGTD